MPYDYRKQVNVVTPCFIMLIVVTPVSYTLPPLALTVEMCCLNIFGANRMVCVSVGPGLALAACGATSTINQLHLLFFLLTT
jgi:hypothetical protein